MADGKIGTKFEDFTILKVLSRGKYGFVAKVKSKIDNKIYAMKRIDLKLIKSEKAVEYYENEYNIADSLNHENVYRALSKFKEKNLQYIITEYMDGGNLLELFNWHKENGIKIDEKKLLNIFVQCLRGLKYIHEQGLIHRSIKHDNIIFDSNYKIKIINFKYSIKKEKNDNEIIDIDRLTAPEMKSKEEGYDERADVYSLGMIFNSLAYLSSRTKPKEEDKKDYSLRIYDYIKKMKSEKIQRPSSSEIYLDFINLYYDSIKAYLKCLIFYFSDNFEKQKNELLMLEARGMTDTSITKNIIELSKVKDYKSKDAISIIEKFRENGLDISIINPNEFIKFILNVMNDEINLNKSEFKKINPKDTNEIKKKNFEKNYYQYIENNKTLISDNFLVSYIKTEKCPNCINGNEYYLYKSDFCININKEILDEANNKYNKDSNNKENGIIKYVFDILNMKLNFEEGKICGNCGNIVRKKSSTKFYEVSKYLIFLCDPEIEFNDEDKEKLSKFKIGKEEVELIENDCTYEYKLISIIIKSKNGYDYYNRKPNENMFSKNDGEKKDDSLNIYELNEMSGKLVALFYYSELKNEGNNINNITLPKDNSSNNNPYPSSINLTITNRIIINSGNQRELRSESSNNINNNYLNSFYNYINNNQQQNNNIQNNVQNQNNARDINNANDNQKKEDESNQDNILMKSIISHRADDYEN